MISITLQIFLVVLFGFTSIVTASENGCTFKARFYPTSDKEIENLFTVIRESDREVRVYSDGLYSIGIFRNPNGLRSAYKFSAEEVAGFLRSERHRGVLVLKVSKGVVPDDSVEQDAFVRELFELFQSCGYKRILILASAGSGVEVLGDRFVGMERHPEELDSE